MAEEKSYPECEKLLKVKTESHAIGNFLEWLEQNGMQVAEWQDGEGNEYNDDRTANIDYVPEGWFPTKKSIETLLAAHFDIDMKKVEDERREMLEDYQNR